MPPTVLLVQTHTCMHDYIPLGFSRGVIKWILSIYDENFPIAIYNSQVPLNIKKKISYEAIELHCLKHNSPKTGWTKYNIFLSVIWKEYALARMNKVKHACSRKSKHEYYFMNSMNELLWSMTWIYNDLSQQNMNIIWLTNVNKKFESQHKNSWSNNSTKKTPLSISQEL